jgi:hypothetical protein
MNIKELLDDWASHSYDAKSTARLSLDLPLHQLAHILALADIFPGRTREQIITDLLNVALDDLEATLPYVKGEKIVAEDEFDDPVYEDAGLTPRFHALSRKYLEQLQSEHQ